MATLVYSDADGVDRSLALGNEPVMVGRSAECLIRSEDPRVSRMHARFYLDQGALWIEDLGSQNGIYVGPNRVTRAPVPTGEIILVGSLLIRLMPGSGTLPPPMGLHGTLATWLDIERKARAAVEEERNAFARRVGELHQELRVAQEHGSDASATMRGVPVDDDDLDRLRNELATARDRVVVLERERVEWSAPKPDASGASIGTLKTLLEEALAARTLAEEAHTRAAAEATQLRADLAELEKSGNTELEGMRIELAKAKEARMMAETAAGVVLAEKLADADAVIARLEKELADAKHAPATPDTRIAELTEQLTTVSGRAEKAEKDLAAAQIRAQGAERNLAHASAQAAKAETRASQVEHKLSDTEIRAKTAEAELGKARERISALETRLGAGDSPIQAAEGRSAKLATDLAEMTKQFEAKRDRLVEIEKLLDTAREQAKHAESRVDGAMAEVAAARAKLAEAERRTTALQAKVDGLSQAESAIAAAAKTKDDASTRVADAEKRIVDATRRAEDAEKRASAADTMAKAMAKDVAEALRRAAEADTRYRSSSREMGELVRRAEQAEARSAESLATIAEAQRHAEEADARIAEAERQLVATYELKSKELAEKYESTQIDLTTKLDVARKELVTKVEALQKDLGGKLVQVQRELAAERSSSLQLVDRKTQLERELAEVKKELPALVKRADAAEKRAVENEVQVETLQDRITDLESGLAVGETAHQANLAELREEIRALKVALAEAKGAVEKGETLATQLRARVGELEKQLADTSAKRSVAEQGLREAHDKLAELERAAASRESTRDVDQARLDDALARAGEADRKIEALAVRAEAADLAIGRAGALQRQLDEAIAKLSYIERETATKARDAARSAESETIATERIASADRRTKEADDRAADFEARANEAEKRARAASEVASQLQTQLAELERRGQRADEAERKVADSDRRAKDAEIQLADLQVRLREMAARVTDAEQRARDMAVRVAEAEQRAQQATMRMTEIEATGSRKVALPSSAMERQLSDAKARITQLEREVANADNVRSFAAETEREIAGLQRELREAKQKLATMTLERDRLADDLRDSRGDSETTNRRTPIPPARGDARITGGRRSEGREAQRDPEVTANLDVGRIESMIERTTELEKKVKRLEAIEADLREQLRDAQSRGSGRDSALDLDEGTATRTGGPLPAIQIAEHVSILEESIDSLRANMRAASDETAIMEQSDSVMAVSSAVSQAAEHIERARAAVRALAKTIGMVS